MSPQLFLHLLRELEANGYEEEINWQRSLQPCDRADLFFLETCWVILNSGMKEQIARKIWERIQEAWREGKTAGSVFRHVGKVKAIEYVRDNGAQLYLGYISAEDKISYLKTIPFIGEITCLHLAKNLGQDCIKPDRHLVRIAKEYNTTPEDLCEKLSRQTGEKKSVVDIVIWRACNLKMI